jgi:hypothetical protein
MNSLEGLRNQIGRITPVDAREARSIAATLERLTWPGDCFDEGQNALHLTASAFVVSARGVILHRHRRLGIWVQPGGHVDRGEGSRAGGAARDARRDRTRRPSPRSRRTSFTSTSIPVRGATPTTTCATS